MGFWEKFNPRADKKILILIAGIMWCGVGVMLISYAFSWLGQYGLKEQLVYYVFGISAAIPVHLFGFRTIAEKNLKRLLPLQEEKCLFSFITWRSYLIIIIMIAMGITLRHSPIPKRYLSVIYNGIGLALFLSGINYIRSSLRLFTEG